jgi:signal transduction histidine kinase
MSMDDPGVGALLQDLALAIEAESRCSLLCELVRRVWIYDLTLALSYAEEGVATARENNLKYAEARCNLEVGRVLRLLGRYAEAERILLPLRDILVEHGDREAAGLAIRTLSALYLDLGLLEQALDFNREALAIFDEIANQRYYCMALMECAEVLKKRHEFDDALATLDNARMRLASLANDELDDFQWLQLKFTRALTLLEAGRYEAAKASAEEALDAAGVFRCKDIETGCHGIMALCHAKLGHGRDLQFSVERFLATVGLASDAYTRIIGWLNCGRAAFVTGDLRTALDHVGQGLQLAEQVGLKGLIADCHETLAEIQEATGDHETALRHFKAFFEIGQALHRAGVQHRIGQMRLQLKVDQNKMEMLESSRIELERVVAERTQELRLAKEQAEIASRSKSDFLAHMSHELRTPLNAVIGFAELMQQEVHGAIGSARYKDYLKDIHDSGTLLLSLINDILDLSKIEAGRQELNREPCSVEDICLACMRLIKDRAAHAGIRMKLSLAPALRPLDADIRAVKQILLNLLTNAVKFTPDGGTVTLFATDDEGPYVTIGVSDTGIGISADDLPRVLEPFGQVQNSFTRAQAGTGLGLPLAKLLTGLHGGKFAIESRLGEGTVVKVMLAPATEPDPVDAAPRRRTFSLS